VKTVLCLPLFGASGKLPSATLLVLAVVTTIFYLSNYFNTSVTKICCETLYECNHPELGRSQLEGVGELGDRTNSLENANKANEAVGRHHSGISRKIFGHYRYMFYGKPPQTIQWFPPVLRRLINRE
jgi:hypothetical protein